MRNGPDPALDPYRTLGLQPGASTAEVKRAYRLLAKTFHPDSAGEAALPRFLAIQEAYEMLTTGRSVRRRGAASTATSAPARSEPWRADPDRARTAREQARQRTRSGRAWGAGTPGTTGTQGSAEAGRGSTSTGRGSGSTGGRGSATSGRATGSSGQASAGATGSASRSGTSGTGSAGSRRRATRKATLGSTSYDEAREVRDATWSGASWYGPSTGEYWIVNPREYADPRKHGPAYQSRARRGAASDEPEDRAADEPGTGRPPERGAAASGGEPFDSSAPMGPGQAATRPRAAWSPRHAGTSEAQASPGEAVPPLDERFAAATRDWLGGPADDPIRRLRLAVVAWPPIGLASAYAIGDVTGCAYYAASCGPSEAILPWLAQAVILGLLLLLPPLARLFLGGTIGVLIAVVPATGFLVALGAGGAPSGGLALAVLLGLAWLLGVGLTGWRALRGTPGAPA